MTEPTQTITITLRAFVDSLMPGNGRTNNLFKFLTMLDEPEIADFMIGLFVHVGMVVDGEQQVDDLESFLIVQETQARSLGVIRGRATGLPPAPLSNPPWASLKRPLGEAAIALFTSGAVRRLEDQPYIASGYSYEQALANPAKAYDRNPSLRIIPGNIDCSCLVVEHIAYDVRAARRDINVIFPIERLRELAGNGNVCQIANYHYAFSGLTNLQTLSEQVLPTWAQKIATAGADAVLLTPG